jgi:hypothetical protein
MICSRPTHCHRHAMDWQSSSSSCHRCCSMDEDGPFLASCTYCLFLPSHTPPPTQRASAPTSTSQLGTLIHRQLPVMPLHVLPGQGVILSGLCHGCLPHHKDTVMEPWATESTKGPGRRKIHAARSNPHIFFTSQLSPSPVQSMLPPITQGPKVCLRN